MVPNPIKFVRIIFGHHHYVNISVRSDVKGMTGFFSKSVLRTMAQSLMLQWLMVISKMPLRFYGKTFRIVKLIKRGFEMKSASIGKSSETGANEYLDAVRWLQSKYSKEEIKRF
jgi:hypothetical protein